ncbi:Endocuticle structural glycoprotein SgAbd-2 [Papilio xuthus]|uniref:Endocuticle structural glycoprotein SgAbd-2 n=1 Tax=Papilio xuthus TaxID=66420 RepID=A0A194PX62_PAPXU|nr:Endocuticle structural glycoprotein SgAbd-2 [Papilio xuthus]
MVGHCIRSTLSYNIVNMIKLFSVALSAVLALTTALPQRRAPEQPSDQAAAEQNYNYQPDYRQPKPIEDFRPKVQLDLTTVIPIIRFDKEQGTDGSYKTSYETGNNIQAEEQGYLKTVGENQDQALVQQGSYSYTAPNGEVITVEYTADEFGFRVKGDHIPTPPPVSPEIQKGLDLIYAGIKANAERAALEAKNNPEAARQQEEKAALDYKGFYYQ